jgi:acetate kinase
MMRSVLTLNAGSSSIKFSLFEAGSAPACHLRGQFDGIGSSPRLQMSGKEVRPIDRRLPAAEVTNHASALSAVLGLLEEAAAGHVVAAVGHRIVHGGTAFSEPIELNEDRLAELERLCPLAPLHQPHNLLAVRAAQEAFNGTLQVGCFDTAFHRAHPWASDTYALPRELYAQGIRRYGFHGLSYEYVAGELRRLRAGASGRTIIAHLGNGASMCALHDGRSVDSTMGFTALDGLPMGTRCGQLDPGVVLYLMEQKRLSVRDIEDLLYRRSGLKGLSGLSQDVRELEASANPEAKEALQYFEFRVRREIGALTATMSGLDTLVFCGGIGENAWGVRERVCRDLAWLGLDLDVTRNAANETIVSSDRSRVGILVIHTNEELMIARHTARLLASLRP